jgi:hypothetical protein
MTKFIYFLQILKEVFYDILAHFYNNIAFKKQIKTI